jgi:ABC-type protease/lipase transport system fused ATPase/permease subunit
LALPKGYDTDIGDYGHRLSGGQSQRIGIARALYGEPRFVVLAEPTSNLDNAGEEALLASLAQMKADRITVAIVAHRPSILANVDKMLVLRANGTVEAFGPRAEVMQQFAKRAVRPQTNVVTLTPGEGGPGRSGLPS